MSPLGGHRERNGCFRLSVPDNYPAGKYGLGSFKKGKTKWYLMELFGNICWGLLDCVTGTFTQIERFPFQIGSGDRCHLILTGGIMPMHCALVDTKEKTICLRKSDPAAQLAIMERMSRPPN